MSTQASVHTAIDQLTGVTLAGNPIAYDNANYDELSNGEIPFVSQKVNFRQLNQFELGRPASARVHGAVFFLVHIRKGSGAADRNALQKLITDAFRSKLIGGATFLNARIIGLGEDKNWTKTGVEIPFYYEEAA